MRKWFRYQLLGVVILLLLPVPGYCVEQPLDLSPTLQALAQRYDLYGGNLTLDEIDFSMLEILPTEQALREYLLECQAALVRQAPVRVPATMDIKQATQSGQFYEWTYLSCEHYGDSGDYLITFDLGPGAEITLAYLTRDTSRLSSQEYEVYQRVQIFFLVQYPWRADAVVRERSIHDFIGESCEYWTDDGNYPGSYTDFRSILGVFGDGKANCSGMTDAFHVLCRLAGFNVQKISGEMHGNPHAWNLIELDGKWYMVDVTNNGLLTDTIPYQFFNAGADLMRHSHTWPDGALRVPLEETTDGKYAYGNPAFAELVRVPDMKTLQTSITQRTREGSGIEQSYMCELFVGKLEPFIDGVLDIYRTGNFGIRHASIATQYEVAGEWLFLTIMVEYI